MTGLRGAGGTGDFYICCTVVIILNTTQSSGDSARELYQGKKIFLFLRGERVPEREVWV